MQTSNLQNLTEKQNGFKLQDLAKKQNQTVMFKEGNYVWYNEMYPEIKPVFVSPNNFKGYQPFTDRLFKKMSKNIRPKLWNAITLLERQGRMEAFNRVFKQRDRYNFKKQKPPCHCYGWKVVETENYTKLMEKTVQVKLSKTISMDEFFDTGNATIINFENPTIKPFFIEPGAYSRSKEAALKYKRNQKHPGLIKVAIELYQKRYPDVLITEEIKKQAYNRFYDLFSKKNSQVHGYQVIFDESFNDSLKLLNVNNPNALGTVQQGRERLIDFFNNDNTNIILKLVTRFYQDYCPRLLKPWSEFLNKDLPAQIKLIPVSLKEKEINDFPTSVETMNRFLTTSLSVYHQLCFFFIENPMTDNELKKTGVFTIEEHHIIPKHRCKNNPLHLNGVINKPFNLLRIPWFLHFFLHILRYMEFFDQDDWRALKRMTSRLSTTDETICQINQESLSRNQFIFNLFNQLKIWQKSKPTQEKLQQDYDSLNRLQSQQKTEIQTLYREKTMVWKNNKYKDLPDLTIPAGTVKLHTDLALILKEHLEKFLNENPRRKKPENFFTLNSRNASNHISRHLITKFKLASKTRSYNSAFWNFYID